MFTRMCPPTIACTSSVAPCRLKAAEEGMICTDLLEFCSNQHRCIQLHASRVKQESFHSSTPFTTKAEPDCACDVTGKPGGRAVARTGACGLGIAERIASETGRGGRAAQSPHGMRERAPLPPIAAVWAGPGASCPRGAACTPSPHHQRTGAVPSAPALQ